VLPALARHGLSWSTLPTIQDDGKFVLRYSLRHTSGQQESGTWPLPATSSPPQALGSAITYARRYCLCAVTGVSPDDDDDGAAAQSAEAPSEPLWDTEIPQLVESKDRAGLLRLHGQAKKLRPGDTALHDRIVSAGKKVVALDAHGQEPAPQTAEPELPAENVYPGKFDRAKETRRIWAQLAKGGVDAKDRDRRLLIMTRMLTRAAPLESFNDLTDTEIAQAVAFMERREASGDLAETLAQMAPITPPPGGEPAEPGAAPHKGKSEMTAQDIDQACDAIAIAHAARREELKSAPAAPAAVADTLWQKVMDSAPERWTTQQINSAFINATGVTPDSATAEDMQRYLNIVAGHGQSDAGSS